jgi:hypothetical protein
MVKVKTTPIVMKHDLRVYFNLVHNILCAHYPEFKTPPDPEHKSAHVRMFIPEEFQGAWKSPDFGGVYLEFGGRTVTFRYLFKLLSEHYEIPEGTEISVTLKQVGLLQSPVGQSMLVQFTTTKAW